MAINTGFGFDIGLKPIDRTSTQYRDQQIDSKSQLPMMSIDTRMMQNTKANINTDRVVETSPEINMSSDKSPIGMQFGYIDRKEPDNINYKISDTDDKLRQLRENMFKIGQQSPGSSFVGGAINEVKRVTSNLKPYAKEIIQEAGPKSKLAAEIRGQEIDEKFSYDNAILGAVSDLSNKRIIDDNDFINTYGELKDKKDAVYGFAADIDNIKNEKEFVDLYPEIPLTAYRKYKDMTNQSFLGRYRRFFSEDVIERIMPTQSLAGKKVFGQEVDESGFVAPNVPRKEAKDRFTKERNKGDVTKALGNFALGYVYKNMGPAVANAFLGLANIVIDPEGFTAKMQEGLPPIITNYAEKVAKRTGPETSWKDFGNSIIGDADKVAGFLYENPDIVLFPELGELKGTSKLDDIGGALDNLEAKIGSLNKTPDTLTKDMINVDKEMSTSISKSIIPTSIEKKGSKVIADFEKNVVSSIDTILDNSDTIKYLDELGDEITKASPETMREFADAITQAKKIVYEDYAADAAKAGEAGAVVNTKPIIDELTILRDKLSKQIGQQNTVDYIDKTILDIQSKPTLDVLTAQDNVQTFNNQLQTFYRNPNYNDVGRTVVDALVNNILRDSLDNAIETALDSPKYMAKKQRYSALKNIEKEVSKRAVVYPRRNTKGLIDFTDFVSADMAINGIIRTFGGDVVGGLGSIARGGILNSIKNLYKKWNSPDYNLQQLIKKVKKAKENGTLYSNKIDNANINSNPVSDITPLENKKGLVKGQGLEVPAKLNKRKWELEIPVKAPEIEINGNVLSDQIIMKPNKAIDIIESANKEERIIIKKRINERIFELDEHIKKHKNDETFNKYFYNDFKKEVNKLKQISEKIDNISFVSIGDKFSRLNINIDNNSIKESLYNTKKVFRSGQISSNRKNAVYFSPFEEHAKQYGNPVSYDFSDINIFDLRKKSKNSDLEKIRKMILDENGGDLAYFELRLDSETKKILDKLNYDGVIFKRNQDTVGLYGGDEIAITNINKLKNKIGKDEFGTTQLFNNKNKDELKYNLKINNKGLQPKNEDKGLLNIKKNNGLQSPANLNKSTLTNDLYNTDFDGKTPRFGKERNFGKISFDEGAGLVKGKLGKDFEVNGLISKDVAGEAYNSKIGLAKTIDKSTPYHEITHTVKRNLKGEQRLELIKEVIEDKKITQAEVDAFNKINDADLDLYSYAEEAIADGFYNYIQGKPVGLGAKIIQWFKDLFNTSEIKALYKKIDKGEFKDKFIKGGIDTNPANLVKATEEPLIDTLNPTGKIFTEYTPQQRANAKLGKNITTLDKTSGKSPDDIITIYRGGEGKEIVPGDFITTNKQLAKDYAGNGNIIEKRVRVGDILDDITEPLGEEYIYRPMDKSKGLLKAPEEPLMAEARKYKSAEEFIDSKLQKQEYRSAHQLKLGDSITADNIDVAKLKEQIRARRGYLSNDTIKGLKELEQLQGNPEKKITIYRASPKEGLNDGDRVTTDKIYANDIKKQNGGKVYSYTAKVGDLRFPTDVETLPSVAMESTFSYSPETSKLKQIREEANKSKGLKTKKP